MTTRIEYPKPLLWDELPYPGPNFTGMTSDLPASKIRHDVWQRGIVRHWINGKQVTKEEFEKAAAGHAHDDAT